MPIFSWSALVLGSTDSFDDRLGEFHALQHDRLQFGEHSVSPVVVSFRPASATMSPAIGFLDVLAVVGMHQQHAADLFASCP